MWAKVILCLGVACLGGVVAARLGVPVPYMLGSVGLTLLAALFGLPIARPGNALVVPMRVVLGVLLGSTITPELLEQAGLLTAAVSAVPVYIAMVGGFGMWYYHRVAKLSWEEAFFAGLPGGIYSLTAFAEESGIDIKRIALAHALRVAIVIITVPFLLSLFVDQVAATPNVQRTGLSDIAGIEFIWFGIAAIIGALLGKWSRLPGGLIIGPMLLSAAFQLSGLSHAAPPSEIVITAQIILGAAIGARFVGQRIRLLGASLVHALGYVFVSLLLTVLVAVLLNRWMDAPSAASVLAFAPGGIAEMTLLALGLGLNVGFVATIQVIRIIVVVGLSPLLFKVLRRLDRDQSVIP